MLNLNQTCMCKAPPHARNHAFLLAAVCGTMISCNRLQLCTTNNLIAMEHAAMQPNLAAVTAVTISLTTGGDCCNHRALQPLQQLCHGGISWQDPLGSVAAVAENLKSSSRSAKSSAAPCKRLA
jgi:hypothetical protein